MEVAYWGGGAVSPVLRVCLLVGQSKRDYRRENGDTGVDHLPKVPISWQN